jgi:hypothetical protein
VSFTRVRLVVGGLIVFSVFGVARAASAQLACGAAIEQAKAEWRSLTHSTHLAASMRINTNDGRHLTGSQLNYVWVLLDRADGACGAGQEREAIGYLHEAQSILHPIPRPL